MGERNDMDWQEKLKELPIVLRVTTVDDQGNALNAYSSTDEGQEAVRKFIEEVAQKEIEQDFGAGFID